MQQSVACRRILVVDDNPTIHADFKKIFQAAESNDELAAAEAAFFGTDFVGVNESSADCNEEHDIHYELTHAYAGPDAVESVIRSVACERAFEIAFVDMRMPDDWDGLRTIEEIWKVDSRVQVVLCTAYSDLSSHDIVTRFGQTDKLLFLKKPFDKVEASQVVAALSEKRRLTDLTMSRNELLESIVEERTANLHIALRKSEAAVRAKAEFISVMSHELKTPLNAIMGFSGILSRSAESAGFSEMHADAAETIHRNGEQLLKLITQVLDYVELDSETCTLTPTECRPADILENAVGEFRRACIKKEVEVDVSVAGVGETIRTDRRVIGKILHHLLENALKYTDAGGSIRVEVDSDHRGRIRFHVRDTGIGIEADRLPTLFVAFEQIDGSHTRTQGGTGLGLSLCHRLASSLNARLSVASEIGRGSTFTVSLPLKSDDGNPPEATEPKPELHSVKMTVGIIAVSQEFADEAQEMVESCGFRVVIDRMDSSKQCQSQPPQSRQVLLVEVSSLQDLETLENLQLEGPVIAVVSDGSTEWEGWEDRVVELGCVDHLTRSALRRTLPSLLRFWAPRE